MMTIGRVSVGTIIIEYQLDATERLYCKQAKSQNSQTERYHYLSHQRPSHETTEPFEQPSNIQIVIFMD